MPSRRLGTKGTPYLIPRVKWSYLTCPGISRPGSRHRSYRRIGGGAAPGYWKPQDAFGSCPSPAGLSYLNAPQMAPPMVPAEIAPAWLLASTLGPCSPMHSLSAASSPVAGAAARRGSGSMGWHGDGRSLRDAAAGPGIYR